jgi:FkbM family methyltransferase
MLSNPYRQLRKWLRPLRRRFVEWRIPALRRDRIDNEHLALLFAYVLREDSNCIDVGANRGTVLEEMLRYAPRGRHLAFEPIPALAEATQRRFPEVDVRPVALGAEAGRAEFVHVVDHEYLSGLRDRTDGMRGPTRALDVEVARLDDLVPEDYVPALIKIDVEGGERDVLLGARRTLATHKPVVAFEFGLGAADKYGAEPTEIFELFAASGLRIFDIDGNGPLSQEDFSASYRSGTIWTYLAHQ